jgi:CDP-glycerol glycerophosphotransferase (TagB/SpsB family)
MHDYVVAQGIQPVCHFRDYTHEGSVKSLLHAISFMDILAQAKYVFICDTFVPVSSGAKAEGTKVVQLCHFSGPFKKIGYATEDDIPGFYKGNVFKNYDLVTASAEAYVPLLTQAMRQEPGVVQALGVSRSDVYFDEAWVGRCRQEFYAQCPDAADKKILLWAPTFRGKAAAPNSLDNETILGLQEKLGPDWMVLIKHHPHDDAVAVDPRHRSNCPIPTERILPVVDMLITDYSTMVLDYLAFDKPFILYAPDLEEYENTRGFFVDYRNITKNMTTEAAQLENMVRDVYRQWQEGDRTEIQRCRQFFTAACDGQATRRIMSYLWSLDSEVN